MRVETPQILWHNGSEGNGKPAPLYSVSLLPLSPPTTIENENQNGNANGNSNSNGNNDNVNILATSGNSNEVHIWKVAFPIIAPNPSEAAAAATAATSKSTTTEEECTSSPSTSPPPLSSLSSSSSSSSSSPTQGRAKRQKILSRQTSTIQHTITLSRHTDRSINKIAFSPCGTHLATAGDGGAFVIHSVPHHIRRRSHAHAHSHSHTQSSISPAVRQFWTCELSSEKDLVSRAVSTHAEDILDLSWSGCGRRIILGSLDNAVFVFEESYSAGNGLGNTHTHGHGNLHGNSVSASAHALSLEQQHGEGSGTPSPMAVDNLNTNTNINVNNNMNMNANMNVNMNINTTSFSTSTSTCNESKWTCVWRNTKEHTHYVQGVAFDPLGVYLASQGCDRTVRVWQRKRGAAGAASAGRGKACLVGSTGGSSGGGSSSSSGNVNGNGNVNGSSNNVNVTGGDVVVKKKKVLAVMDSNANGKACNAGNSSGGRSNGMNMNIGNGPSTSNRPAYYNERALGKFEVCNKAKMLKYRSSSSNNNNNNNGSANKTTSKGNENNTPDGDKNVPNNGSINTTCKKRHLFADESSVESFFRRLAWTKDGAFLITPASLFHSSGGQSTSTTTSASTMTSGDTLQNHQQQQPQQPSSSSSSPTFATYLFARHQYDRPYKVLSGLEKPSVVVRPNPILFQLPKDVQSESKENMKQPPPPQSALSPSPSPSSHLHNSNNNSNTIPYRSIFAVLTIDTILIYDTYHSRPLCIVRGLHYAGLTDCTWSPDGRNLVVSSTDGYISILSFAKGELGEEYVNFDTMETTAATNVIATNSARNSPLSSSPTLTSRNVMTEAEVRTVLQSQNRNLPSCPPSSVLPLCEPGQSATLVAPPSKKARLSYNGGNESLSLVKDGGKAKAQLEEGAEENAGQGGTNNASMETEVVGAVTNLTIDGKLQREVNQMQQIC